MENIFIVFAKNFATPAIGKITLEFFAIDVNSYLHENNCNQIIKKSISICYDYNLKAAKAVSYTLFAELVNENNIEKRLSFRVLSYFTNTILLILYLQR